MIPTTRSGPGLVCRRLATLKADGQFDPVVLQIARFMAPHDILPGLRQRVNLHARSLEMESLLVDLEIADSRVSPAAEDDVQSPEISRMTWSSDSSRPRSKVLKLWC
jgi:hypothetical protein